MSAAWLQELKGDAVCQATNGTPTRGATRAPFIVSFDLVASAPALCHVQTFILNSESVLKRVPSIDEPPREAID